MIRTIIFDMGGVILHYDPALCTRRVTRDPEEARILEEEVFYSEEWARLDKGTIELEEFDAVVSRRIPESMRENAHELLYNWHENLTVYVGMERLMGHLHEKGYPLYLLSNAGQQFHIYSKHIPAFRYLNGMVVSSYLQMVKPEPEIYEYLLNTFGLEPDECLFIDDAPANVEAARNAGIQAYCYADGNLKKLCRYLVKEGILEEDAIASIL